MRHLPRWSLTVLLGLGAAWSQAGETEPCLQGGKKGLTVRASPHCVAAFREQGLSDRFKATVERSVTPPSRTDKARKGEEARGNLQQLMQKSVAERPPKRGYYGQE